MIAVAVEFLKQRIMAHVQLCQLIAAAPEICQGAGSVHIQLRQLVHGALQRLKAGIAAHIKLCQPVSVTVQLCQRHEGLDSLQCPDVLAGDVDLCDRRDLLIAQRTVPIHVKVRVNIGAESLVREVPGVDRNSGDFGFPLQRFFRAGRDFRVLGAFRTGRSFLLPLFVRALRTGRLLPRHGVVRVLRTGRSFLLPLFVRALRTGRLLPRHGVVRVLRTGRLFLLHSFFSALRIGRSFLLHDFGFVFHTGRLLLCEHCKRNGQHQHQHHQQYCDRFPHI